MTRQTNGALTVLRQPLPGAVIQRDGRDGDIPLLLDAAHKGALYGRLRKGRNPVRGFNWRKVGAADGTTAQGVVKDVPVGGQYTLDIELRTARGKVIGSATARNLLVGDLWIIGGQSNMDGWGKLVGTEPPSPVVHAFYYDDRWDVALDPLCWHSEAVDRVHWPVPEEQLAEAAKNDRRFRQAGAGPAVAFGKAIYRDTGIPVGLIVCSHGGTSMDQWSPAKASEGGGSFYGSMLRRVKAVGGTVTGMIWYQGESDANKDGQPKYREKMRNFVAAVRRDLDARKLPFIYVQIGCFFAGAELAEAWNRLQADQLVLEDELAPAAMASAIDLGLDDGIHIGTASQRRLGRRLAYLAGMLVYGKRPRRRGPRPAEMSFADQGRKALRVRFADVNGGLRPRRPLRGFWAKKDGKDLAIVSQVVDSRRLDTVVLTFEEPVPPGSSLWYGYGISPAANLVDGADLAAPVFGPVTI